MDNRLNFSTENQQDWDLEAGCSDTTYAGEETYACRDSGYFDQSQSVYRVHPAYEHNQMESQGNEGSGSITYGDCGVPDEDSCYTNLPVCGIFSTSHVYDHGGQSNSDGKNLELKALDHRQTEYGYHTVSQRTKTPKANIDNSETSSHFSEYGVSFGASGAENENGMLKLEEKPSQNRTPSPSPAHIFKPEFLNLNSKQSDFSPTESPNETSDGVFKFSQSFSTSSFPKPGLHVANTNRHALVLLDAEKNGGNEKRPFRQKSNSVPNAHAITINGGSPGPADRKLSGGQFISESSHETSACYQAFLKAERDLEGKAWYDGSITKQEAFNFLREKKAEGYFIVRKGSKGWFSVTFFTTFLSEKEGDTFHSRIHFDENCHKWKLAADATKRKPGFDSVSELVEHYVKNGFKNDEGWNVKLKKPLKTRRSSTSKSMFGMLKLGMH